ncbi:MAG TPA: ribosome-associated translation inhibitor RaiA [Abditibacteriaceae bacterium]|nr:ribosome-associated translation inhibitor RaiA [Abditibacteriaceae bacterium]
MNTNNATNVEVHARHCEVEPELRGHIAEKIQNLERFWPRLDDAHVRLTHKRGRYVAEVTLISNGMITRGEEAADNLRLAFDTAIDKLERQLQSYKKKVMARQRRHNNRDDDAGTMLNSTVAPAVMVGQDGADAPGSEPSEADHEAAETGEQVVRVKRFALKPMSPEEAALQMDLLGHVFFVFRDAESDQVSVVYRRRNGSCGLIEPVSD